MLGTGYFNVVKGWESIVNSRIATGLVRNMSTVAVAIFACLAGYFFVAMDASPFGLMTSSSYAYGMNVTTNNLTDEHQELLMTSQKVGTATVSDTSPIIVKSSMIVTSLHATSSKNISSLLRKSNVTPSSNTASSSSSSSSSASSSMTSSHLLTSSQDAPSLQNVTDISADKLREMLRKALDSDALYDARSSQFMLQLYNNLRRGHNISTASGHVTSPLDAIKPDTIRSFSPKGVSIAYTRTIAFDYKVPRLPQDEQIRMAEFRLKRSAIQHHLGSRVKIFIKRGHVRVKKVVVRVKPTRSSDRRYDIYDITAAIKPWINGLHGNVTIKIVVRSRIKMPKNSDKRDLVNTLLGDGQDYGLLVFYSEDKQFMHKIYTSFTGRKRRHRAKRDVREKRESTRKRRRKNRRERKKPCRKVDLEINFNEIGWGRWIMFPKTYNSFACKGVCRAPIPADLNPTNHAMLQSLARQKRGRKVAPMPCCVPVTLKPLSMLYYEYDEIVVRHHDDMIVGKCGCR